MTSSAVIQRRLTTAEFLFRFILAVVLRLSVLVECQQYVDDRPPPVAMTDRGPVRGFRYTVPELGSVRGTAYLGIPFAEPPVGPRRFLRPMALERSWTTVRDATRPPNSCYQGPDLFFGDEFPGSTMWNPNTELSEDCLYVNVWVPDTSPSDRKRAVMVWIFGGGFYSGTTTLDCYDGRLLAAKYDVVVISIGYRVGVFGFLCFDERSDTCNAGLYDQLLGMDWVQRNAAAFDGDPTNVTLFGESAGSVSVSLHLLSPLSRDKFHRAILQSGSANMPWGTTSIAEARLRSEELAVTYLGCPAPSDGEDASRSLIDCLRDIDPSRLVDEQWVSRGILQFPFLPVVDGKFLPQPPELMLEHRSFNPCPILIGSNRNEGSWFIVYELSDRLTVEPGPRGDDREPIEVRPGDERTVSRDQFLSAINTLFFYYPQYRQELNSSIGRDAITFQYTDWNSVTLDDSSVNVGALDSAVGDSNFVCPLNWFARSYASAGMPVYMYYFSERYQSSPWPTWMGVLHGDEILFMFGQVLKEPPIVTSRGNWKLVYTDGEKRLSRAMMRYWSNFAKTGDPNRREWGSVEKDTDRDLAAVEWPLYGPSSREYIQLNSALLDERDRSRVIGRAPRAKQCAFWLDYLPKLITSTADIKDREKAWKLQFSEWTTRYIVDWKALYDLYAREQHDRCSTLQRHPPR